MTATASPPAEVFMKAAADYLAEGIVPHPLVLDANGKPKRPLTVGWTQLTADPKVIRSLDWSSAKGIGGLCGPASGNVCAIDIDDEALADAVEATRPRTRFNRTYSNRGHLFVREATPSRSTAFKVRWQGREIGIELRCEGNQVSLPPSPRYRTAIDLPIMDVPTIADAWRALAAKLGIEEGLTIRGSAGFPSPWLSTVGQGDRNKSVYVESHRLREARMPLAQAIGIMRVRYESAHEPGSEEWREVERTVQSAYRGGLPPEVNLLTAWTSDNFGGWAE